VSISRNCNTYAALRDYVWEFCLLGQLQGEEKSLTAGAESRKSSIVKGGGITKALSVASGGFSGSGMDERNAFLALSNSWGSSVLGEAY
jgi:hypothetical protein